MGATILTVAGLSELVARSTEEYVAIATALASDRDRLRSVRHNLRDRMAAGPHMDHQLLCRNVEDAFRSMWRVWVERNTPIAQD
jgi:predicted O-linked N-acetylglucosamine transferase (SPINDLY family)